jgi:hypothetical protein
MPIAIDASTPAIVSGTTSATTASFTAPADSLLVALCAAGGGASTLSMSNSGTALTWTTQVQHIIGEDTGAFSVAAFIATAVPATSVARTVTFASSTGGATVDMKLLVVTGADVAGTPVGAKGEGHSTTANLSPTVFTSTLDLSRAMGIAADADASGSPTSSDVGFAFNHIFDQSGIAVYKAADTALAGTGVTLNFNGTGGTRSWNWAAVEVLPAVAPFVAPPPVVVGQAVNRSYTY